MRKSMAIVLTIMIALSFSTAVAASLSNNNNLVPMEASYIGASTTGKFHYISCYWANKIRQDHRIYFESRDEAMEAGYIPCKVCKP